MKKTIQHIPTLILLLAIFVLPLSMCKATLVFEDFTNGDVSGNAILGSTPLVGGVWQGSAGGATGYGVNQAGNTEATLYSAYTDGAGASLFSAFTTLGTGKILTLSFNLIGFGNGSPSSPGYAGVSLYTGFVNSGNAGAETEFVGEPSGAASIGLDQAVSGNHNTGNTNVPTIATFTYVYDTGAWTFTTTGGVNLSGTGPAGKAFNALQVHNGGNGGNIDLNDLTVDISSVATPTFAAATPANGSYSAAISGNISIQAFDGNPATVNTNTIVMNVDGSTVTPAITKSANVTTISYTPGSPLSAGTLHTALVTVKDSNNNSYTNAWSFTTALTSPLPVAWQGPFSVSNGVDLVLFTTNDTWLGTNYGVTSSKTVYVTFNADFVTANPLFGGLEFYQGTTEQLLLGKNAGSVNWSVGAGAPNEDMTPTTTIVPGQWQTVVVRLDYQGGGNANVSIWLDPVFTQTEANQPNAPLTFSMNNTFTSIHLRCGNGGAIASYSNIVVSATSAGAGFVAPASPTFVSYIPGQNAAAAAPNTPISVEALFGTYGISSNAVTLNLDGNNVTPTFVVTTNSITVTYQPPTAFTTGSSHTVTVSLTDSNGAPYSTSWSFGVDLYPVLPVSIAGPIDVTGGGLGTTIFGSTNGWLGGNYLSTSTNTLYARFSMTFFATNGTPGTFGGLHFYLGTGTEHLITGDNFGSGNWSLDTAQGNGPGELDLLPVTPIVLGDWHTMVVKSVYSSNAPTAETIWLDPDFTKSEVTQPQTPLTLSMNNTFDTIRLRAGNGGTYAEYTNIVIAATATGVGFAPAPPVMSLYGVTLSWTGTGGTLQQAPAVTGPWTDSGNQSNPQTIVTTNSAMFYRLRP
jgi:hypothetical protein